MEQKNDFTKEIADRVLVSREEIQQAVARIGAEITKDYEGKELFVIGVLKGGFMFMADLVREINLPLQLDFIAVSSYGSSTKTSGVVRMIKDIDKPLDGKHLLIVEDIIDSGVTLKYLKEMFATRGPLSIKVCTIFDKPSRRKVEMKGDYVGIEIPDEFVIGYGLDYDGKYRNLPDLCVLRRDVYEKE
ncbi:MAG: hypoxanthine phosphoribosyltransferase [Clostridia bacterium]|nr:hypoxanthine phosphoribosyltransferase [Clostridia bacterium]